MQTLTSLFCFLIYFMILEYEWPRDTQVISFGDTRVSMMHGRYIKSLTCTTNLEIPGINYIFGNNLKVRNQV